MSFKNSIAEGIKPIKFLPGIAWFFILLVLVFLPGKDVPNTDWLLIASFDKLVHAGLFGGLVFLFCMPFKKATLGKQQKINLFLRIMLATIVFGLTTELIQKYFIPGRQYDLMDWLADSIGALLAYLLSRRLFI